MSKSNSKDTSRQQLIRPTILITLLSILAFGTSFLLQIILAARFGAQQSMDAYLVAITIPDLLNAVLLGSLNIALIPMFIESKLHDGVENAWHLVSSFINLFLITLIFIALIGMFAAPVYLHWLAPGFEPNGEAFHTSKRLVYLLFPSVIFNGLAGLLSSIYKAEHRFIWPALTPVLNSIIMVGVVLVLSPSLGITSVALGLLIGSIAQFVFLLPILFSSRRYHPIINWRQPAFRRTLMLMLPWILGALIYKSNLIIDRFLASQLPEGSISYLGYAYKLTTISVTILTIGISTTFFPTMSRFESKGDIKGLRETISLGLRMIMLMVMPVMIIVLVLNVPVIELLFERGAFTHDDTRATGATWVAYLGAFMALSFGNIISFAFYAIKDTKTPAYVGVIGMGLNIAVAFALTPYLAQLGPALAFSAMALFNLLVLTILLSRRLGGLEWYKIWQSGSRICLAGLLMGLILWQLYAFWAPMQLAWAVNLFAIGASIALGGSVYLALLLMMGVSEIRKLYAMISKRVPILRSLHS